MNLVIECWKLHTKTLNVSFSVKLVHTLQTFGTNSISEIDVQGLI